MEFRKMLMITLYAEQKKDTDVYNSLLDSVGEGEGGMFQKVGYLISLNALLASSKN